MLLKVNTHVRKLGMLNLISLEYDFLLLAMSKKDVTVVPFLFFPPFPFKILIQGIGLYITRIYLCISVICCFHEAIENWQICISIIIFITDSSADCFLQLSFDCLVGKKSRKGAKSVSLESPRTQSDDFTMPVQSNSVKTLQEKSVNIQIMKLEPWFLLKYFSTWLIESTTNCFRLPWINRLVVKINKNSSSWKVTQAVKCVVEYKSTRFTSEKDVKSGMNRKDLSKAVDQTVVLQMKTVNFSLLPLKQRVSLHFPFKQQPPTTQDRMYIYSSFSL